MISFNLNFIMQLKQFYDIATKVSSKKSVTTFGDLPDCLRYYMVFPVWFNMIHNIIIPHEEIVTPTRRYGLKHKVLSGAFKCSSRVAAGSRYL